MTDKKRVLITGGNGFLGRYFNDFLIQKGYFVSSYAKDMSQISLEGEHYDRIFHFAGKVGVPESWENPALFFQSNFLGTLSLLEAVRDSKTPITFLSTVAVQMESKSPYALSKVYAEDMCRFFERHFSVPVTVLRLHNIYGRGQKKNFLIPHIIRQLLDADVPEITLFNLKPQRDYLYIDDLCALLEKTLLERKTGTYEVGSGVLSSVKEVLEICQEILGIQKPIVIESPDAIVSPLQSNVREVQEAFKWAPHFSLKRGLQEVVNWHESHSVTY